MLALTESIAVLACLIFTGAAVYITFVEHPARMACETECALRQWVPSYKRATIMQANLALIATAAAIAAWFQRAGVAWLLGGILIFAVVPITLIVIRPTNQRLLAAETASSAPTIRALLVRWGKLHMLRSALSALASLVLLRASM